MCDAPDEAEDKDRLISRPEAAGGDYRESRKEGKGEEERGFGGFEGRGPPERGETGGTYSVGGFEGRGPPVPPLQDVPADGDMGAGARGLGVVAADYDDE